MSFKKFSPKKACQLSHWTSSPESNLSGSHSLWSANCCQSHNAGNGLKQLGRQGPPPKLLETLCHQLLLYTNPQAKTGGSKSTPDFSPKHSTWYHPLQVLQNCCQSSARRYGWEQIGHGIHVNQWCQVQELICHGQGLALDHS